MAHKHYNILTASLLLCMLDAYAVPPHTVIDIVDDPATALSRPHALGIAPDGGKAYVLNDNNTLCVVDLATNRVTGLVDDSSLRFNAPSEVVFVSNKKAYVTNTGNDKVLIIDTATNTVTGEVNSIISLLHNPCAIAVVPERRRAYVCTTLIGPVKIIDVESDVVVGYVEGSVSSATGIFVRPSGSHLYTTNFSASASVIDLEANRVTGRYATPQGFVAHEQMVITPNGKKAYVANAGEMGIFDLDRTELIRTIPGLAGRTLLAINPAGTIIYAVQAESNTIKIFDLTTDAFIGTVDTTLRPLAFPASIRFAPDGRYAYIVNRDNNTVSRVLVEEPVAPAAPEEPVAPAAPEEPAAPAAPEEPVAPAAPEEPAAPAAPEEPVAPAAPEEPAAPAAPEEPVAPAAPEEPAAPAAPEEPVAPAAPEEPVAPVASSVLAASAAAAVLVSPPHNVRACKLSDRFLAQMEWTNRLSWNNPTDAPAPVTYKIYRDAGLTNLIATISANSALVFSDHNRNPGETYQYYLVGVDAAGNVSSSVSVTATDNCS